MRICDLPDGGCAGIQIDGVDQHLVDAGSAVGSEVDPVVVTPRRTKVCFRDSRGRPIRIGKCNRPDAHRVVVAEDAELTSRGDPHRVGALAVTEINPESCDI